jgi:hypothetical protein
MRHPVSKASPNEEIIEYLDTKNTGLTINPAIAAQIFSLKSLA